MLLDHPVESKVVLGLEGLEVGDRVHLYLISIRVEVNLSISRGYSRTIMCSKL